MTANTLRADIINPFVASTTEILCTMAETKVERQGVYIKNSPNPLGELTALMPLRGDAYKGSFALSLDIRTVSVLGERLLKEPIRPVDEEYLDVVGELSNMISGGARKRLWKEGMNFDMAQPLAFNSPSPFSHLVEGPVLVIPLSTDAGDLFIELLLVSALRRAAPLIEK